MISRRSLSRGPTDDSAFLLEKNAEYYRIESLDLWAQNSKKSLGPTDDFAFLLPTCAGNIWNYIASFRRFRA
jgi:hypothetical protein